MNVWDSAGFSGGDDHLIDNFTITTPGEVSNFVDQSHSLTVQGQHGIGNLTLAFFNISTDPVTLCNSADVSTFSTSSQSDCDKFCQKQNHIVKDLFRFYTHTTLWLHGYTQIYI